MQLEFEDLKKAVEQGVLSGLQANQLWQFLEKRQAGVVNYSTPRFKLTVSIVAYYTAATLIIVALAIYLIFSKYSLGYGGTLVLTIVYALGFAGFGYTIWRKSPPVYRVLGGLLCTLCVGTVSLVVYNFLQLTDLFITQPNSQDDSYRQLNAVGFLLDELVVISIGLGLLWFVRFPFLTAPIAAALYILVVYTLPDALKWIGKLTKWNGFLSCLLLLR